MKRITTIILVSIFIVLIMSCSNSTSVNAPDVPDVNVGDIINFAGREWQVLDIGGSSANARSRTLAGNRVLVISKYIIDDAHSFHKGEDITWADSDIRAWLNGEYLNSFSPADRARIVETTVINENNQWFGDSGGVNTRDKIFLLSISEVVRYFGDSGQLKNPINHHFDRFVASCDSFMQEFLTNILETH